MWRGIRRDKRRGAGRKSRRLAGAGLRNNPFLTEQATGRDCDLERREIIIRTSEIIIGTSKTGKGRLIPISTRLLVVLELAGYDPAGRPLPPEAHVFGDALGRRVGTIRLRSRATVNIRLTSACARLIPGRGSSRSRPRRPASRPRDAALDWRRTGVRARSSGDQHRHPMRLGSRRPSRGPESIS